ncbi:MAG TPA: class I mannose-6-phosphate isomerase [Candidatus Paceibacterota bacterium]|nr:class I mannose-6-phosphate isomerase [Verrucomicrobiota bacterium]HRY48597.1 class I mannose-6-phosphate isomerase [Candidatus Paceibacterota bacterium]HSA00526.1 class I mannose-6-phosphate isomerase [Candidatus Paceibacterota bacterium]
MSLYPLCFRPVFMERVWGGRKMAELYGKALPPDVPIGESWEISDRTDVVSVIENGPWAGRDLRWLMEQHGEALMGAAAPLNGRFPLLIKILDARADLSLQVHPPAAIAGSLHGDPKSEMWYVTDTAPDARLFAGLKQGVQQAEFEQRLQQGTVADCFHQIPVRAGDAMWLPSGRVHGLGAGVVLFEIQQNSDTTYRVFDWNRVGLDGQPRQLHIDQAMASIDFNDFEPGLIQSKFSRSATVKLRFLLEDPLFSVHALQIRRGQRVYLSAPAVSVLGLVEGRLVVRHQELQVSLRPGQFCMIPACLEKVSLTAETRVTYLQIQAGGPQSG